MTYTAVERNLHAIDVRLRLRLSANSLYCAPVVVMELWTPQLWQIERVNKI